MGLAMMAFVVAPVLMPIPWVLSLAAGFALLYLKEPKVRWALLGLSVFLSLFWPAQSLNILLDRSYYEATPSTLQGLNESGRLFFTPPLLARSIHLQGSDMKDAYEGAKTYAYPNWPLAYGREEAPIYNTLQLRHSSDWAFGAFRISPWLSRDVLDYLGIRYLFGKVDLPGLENVGSGADVVVHRIPKPSPKWFAALRAVQAGPSVEEDLRKADKSTFDLSRNCFVEDGTKAGIYSPRTVKVSVLGPNRLELETKGKGKALIVSSETAYPGWVAQVGGHDRSLELVNHAFRGILLGDAETSVKMSFRPVTFQIGLFLTLLVLGLWSFLLGKRFLNENE
jgi:hypothetical protein